MMTKIKIDTKVWIALLLLTSKIHVNKPLQKENTFKIFPDEDSRLGNTRIWVLNVTPTRLPTHPLLYSFCTITLYSVNQQSQIRVNGHRRDENMTMTCLEPQRNSLLKSSFFGKYLAATVIKSFSSCFISCVPLISGKKKKRHLHQYCTVNNLFHYKDWFAVSELNWMRKEC